MGSCQSKKGSEVAVVAAKEESQHSTGATDDASIEAKLSVHDELKNGSEDSETKLILRQSTSASMGKRSTVDSVLYVDDDSQAFPFPIYDSSLDEELEEIKTKSKESMDESVDQFNSKDVIVNQSSSKNMNRAMTQESEDNNQSVSKEVSRDSTYNPNYTDSANDTAMYATFDTDDNTVESRHIKRNGDKNNEDVFKSLMCGNELNDIVEIIMNCGRNMEMEGASSDAEEDLYVDDDATVDSDVSFRKVTSRAISSVDTPTMDTIISTDESNSDSTTTTLGVHFSVLKDIMEAHLSSSGSLDRNTATTNDIIAEIVKKHPELSERKASWIEFLQQENTCKKGVPMVAPATAMISHTWRYLFASTAETIIQYGEEHERTTGRPFYIWMDMFILNQFATESFDPNWLQETFTNVIKDIGLTISIMTPFDNPAAINRVWCLWELYLSIRYAKLHVALPPDQSERLDDVLLTEPYLLTTMLEQFDNISARNADAFDPKDKDMIFEAITSSIGFDELDKTIVGALREWIDEKCEEKIRAIKDGTLDASKALASPATYSGSGSTLFRAIKFKCTGLAKLSMLHPECVDIINGTDDSWPPFATALTMGLCDIADAILEHPAYDLSVIPWQIDSYMITEKPGHNYHPNFDKNVPQARVQKTLEKFFAMRAGAGHSKPTYEEFVDMSVGGTMPSEWAY